MSSGGVVVVRPAGARSIGLSGRGWRDRAAGFLSCEPGDAGGNRRTKDIVVTDRFPGLHNFSRGVCLLGIVLRDISGMKDHIYEYDTVIHEIPEKGGAYLTFPWDVRKEFGKGRIKVHAEFDGIPYDGSVVNMGLKNPDGSICYIIGLLKSIRRELGKGEGDPVHVKIRERES